MISDLLKRKYTHYFQLLDANKNGVLQENDFLSIGKRLCVVWHLQPGEEQYQNVMITCKGLWIQFRDFVKGPSAQEASLEEWLHFAEHGILANPDIYDKYVNQIAKNIFHFFDVNNDGSLSISEYLDLLRAYGIEIRHSAKSFIQLDLDRNGAISIEEMVQAVREYFTGDDPNARGNWLFGEF